MRNRIILFLSLIVFLSCGENSSTIGPHPNTREQENIRLISEDFNGDPVIIAGSQNFDFITAFKANLASELRLFEAVQSDFPIIMEDQFGNGYDIFGTIIYGPEAGQQLEAVNCGFGYSFLFTSSFPGIDIFGQGPESVVVKRDSSLNWSVPLNGLDQGNFFDNIKSLSSPNFIRYSLIKQRPDQEFYLDIQDEVICVRINGELKVYPKKIMYWHETINDICGGIPICVSYTTLTNSAKVWLRENGDEFGVTGSIYNNNLLAFDRRTESFWSQLFLESVYGPRIGEQLQVIPHLETSLQQLLRIESNPNIVSDETGYDHDYSKYPWGEYRTNDLIVYNLLYLDQRIPIKESVFAVQHHGLAKIYRWDLFP